MNDLHDGRTGIREVQGELVAEDATFEFAVCRNCCEGMWNTVETGPNSKLSHKLLPREKTEEIALARQ